MDKRKVLFGAGNIGRKAVDFFGAENIAAFCDNLKHGNKLEGIPIISFEEFLSEKEDFDVVITVLNRDAVTEIREDLEAHNVTYTLMSDILEKRNASEPIGTIFSRIYRDKEWGDGEDVFYSGNGSHDRRVTEPYISLLCDLIALNGIRTVCDIGCGDFHIMRQVLEKCGDVHYTGIDVVKELTDYNQKVFGNERICFCCMDASDKDTVLPSADLVIIRQVLQHLNNERIKTVLSKTCDAYRFALISEHIPIGEKVRPNIDKSPGLRIRLDKGSGVFIEKPPFSLGNVIHLLGVESDGGIIRTSLVQRII